MLKCQSFSSFRPVCLAIPLDKKDWSGHGYDKKDRSGYIKKVYSGYGYDKMDG